MPFVSDPTIRSDTHPVNIPKDWATYLQVYSDADWEANTLN